MLVAGAQAAVGVCVSCVRRRLPSPPRIPPAPLPPLILSPPFIHTCETTVCVTWKSSVNRLTGMSAVNEPSTYCWPALPDPWKGTMLPLASLARRLRAGGAEG